jgi:hypothetical protein
MDRLDLVIDLVFNNEETFKNLTGGESVMILQTAKIASKNTNITHAAKRFKVQCVYDDLYDKLADGCYLMHHACNEKQRQEANARCEEAKYMLEDIKYICDTDNEFKDCLSRLIMAEHKEGIYGMLYSSDATTMTDFIFRMCESYFIDKLGICTPYCYIHDPSHYMFEGYSYMFYENIEKHGKRNMLELKKEYDKDESDDED